MNEYCRPDRPFYPCPTEWTATLPRTRTVEVYDGSKWVKGEWFTPSNSSEALGSSFAFCRGAGGRPRAAGTRALVAGRGWGSEWECYADIKSLQALWTARTEQLKVLSDTVVVESQSLMQVGLK